MGNEHSHEQIISNAPPRRLKDKTISAIAEYIKSGHAEKIVVMTGAGISTAAGIPDFRSPDTGLYANLARLNLPYAEAVFDISYFRRNPDPFYILAKELYPGQFHPTISHAFVALLEKKELLLKLFTQNIDTLERKAGVPGEQIVEAHGSFSSQRCIDCKTEFPGDRMMDMIIKGEVPHCEVPQCNGLVKPDIVFFGESLPATFFQNIGVPAQADLVIVMGTSLTVHPFASLPSRAEFGVPRVLFNSEKVGDLGSRPDDVLVLGDCDDGIRKLADALGWSEELETLWESVGGKTKEKEATRAEAERAAMSRDEALEHEVDLITREVEQSLKLSKEHEERVRSHSDESPSERMSQKGLLKETTTEESKPRKLAINATVESDGEATPELRSETGLKEPLPTPALEPTSKFKPSLSHFDDLLEQIKEKQDAAKEQNT